jgi:ankyrin repeat protein
VVQKFISIHYRESNPLFAAAKFRNFEVVKYLVEKGANVNSIDYGDFSPLFAAIFSTIINGRFILIALVRLIDPPFIK